jgi:hypothetical protein
MAGTTSRSAMIIWRSAVDDSFPSDTRRPVADALGLLNRAISILDSENMPIAAAKVDEARCAVRRISARRDAAFLAEAMQGDPR